MSTVPIGANMDIFIQVTSVQFILVTDGDISFAVFNYEGSPHMDFPFQIGFDAGDQKKYTVINDVSNRGVLQRSKLVYRIDGEYKVKQFHRAKQADSQMTH